MLLPGCACCKPGCEQCMARPEYLVVEIKGIGADCTPPNDGDTQANQGVSLGWNRDASTINRKYLLRFDGQLSAPLTGGQYSRACVWSTASTPLKSGQDAPFLSVTATQLGGYPGGVETRENYDVVVAFMVGVPHTQDSTSQGHFAFGWRATSCALPTVCSPIKSYSETLAANAAVAHWRGFDRETGAGQPDSDWGYPLMYPILTYLSCAPGATATVRAYDPVTDADAVPWRQPNFKATRDGDYAWYDKRIRDIPAVCDADYWWWNPSCVEGELGCVHCNPARKDIRVYSDGVYPTYPFYGVSDCADREIVVTLTLSGALSPPAWATEYTNKPFALQYQGDIDCTWWGAFPIRRPYSFNGGTLYEKGCLTIRLRQLSNTSDGYNPFTQCGANTHLYEVSIAFNGLSEMPYPAQKIVRTPCVARVCRGVVEATGTASWTWKDLDGVATPFTVTVKTTASS